MTWPSRDQIQPSSSTKPPADSRLSNVTSTKSAGSGRSARKWIVRSIVGTASGSDNRTKTAGSHASVICATSAASIGVGSSGRIQPPVNVDSCAPLNDPVKQTDTWLSTQVPMILNSQAYKNGGALFITWDEGEGSDGPIGMIALSPSARGRGYANAIHYTHSSTLRTLEEIFGVSPWLGDAANATDLRDLFSTFP